MKCALLMILFSILVGAGRYAIPGHDLSWAGTYEAFAHIWVVILITIGIYEWPNYKSHTAWLSLFLITALETFKFLTR